MSATRTSATLRVSSQTYNEIGEALTKAGYNHVFVKDAKYGNRIDMDGISLWG